MVATAQFYALETRAESGRFPPSRPESTSRDSPAPALAQALALIEDAQHGSADAAAGAVTQLRRMVADAPQHALARAHLGVALVLQARDAPILEKRRLAAEGMAEVDAAVAIAPEDPEVRLVRAVNASQMPLLLGRNTIARADFAWLLDVMESQSGSAPELKRRVLFQAGAFALRERRMEAIPLLERALATAASSPPENVVQSMLALARREFTSPDHADVEEDHQNQAAAP